MKKFYEAMTQGLESVKEETTMKTITKFAFEQARSAIINLKKSPEIKELYGYNTEELEKQLAQAEGMIISLCYFPDSPFNETAIAIDFLYYLVEDEDMAKELYK